MMSRETVLRQYVDSVKRDYDCVLLDCHPSLGMLVINVLSALDYMIVPVQADYLAAEDMTELVGTVQSIQRQITPRLPRIVRALTDDEAIYSKIENVPRSVAPKITFKYFESI